MAHTEDWNDLYKEEEEMLDLLPRKADDFKGDTISIDYLKEDTDQTAEQLALPLPKWADGENLEELLDGQMPQPHPPPFKSQTADHHEPTESPGQIKQQPATAIIINPHPAAPLTPSNHHHC